MRATRIRALCCALLLLVLVVPAASQAAPSGPSISAAGRGDVPLLVVVDTSGSMNDQDSGGRLKIESAKRSVLNIEQNQTTGTPMGVWTYPGNGGCDGGGFVPGLDMPTLNPAVRTKLTADVLALEAGGDTPTAPALEAAAAALSARGYTGATVILISDGESTCGGDPCEVAEQIVDDGFHLQVHGVGFDLSGDGRDELQCVSRVTKGRYFDVADGAELIETTKALSRSALEVTVDAPKSAIGGGMATLSATVTNTSTTEAAPDITLSLAFTESPDLFPRVVPPRLRIGNLDPGTSSMTYYWDLPVTSIDSTRTARWRVTATSENGAFHEASEQITVLRGDDFDGLAQGFLRTLMDDPDARVGVFGDSYASGEGAGTYRPGTDQVHEWCHRSDKTHVAQLFGAGKTSIYACSGAVRDHLFTPYPGRMDNWSQVEEMGNGPTLDAAFLSMGGNDIGFADIVADCLRNECGLEDAEADGTPTYGLLQDSTLSAKIRSLTAADALPSTYTRLHDALNIQRYLDDRGGREAPLFVLAYPKPFPEITGIGCGEFTAREVTFANKVVDELNNAIARAVNTAAGAGRSIHFIHSVEHAMQPSNTLCDGDATGVVPVTLLSGGYEMYVNKLTPREQEFVHPNELGYRRIAGAIATWSTTGLAPEANGLDGGAARPAPEVVSRVDVTKCVPLRFGDPLPAPVHAGTSQSTAVGATALRPGSCVIGRVEELRRGTAWAEVHSTPRVLAYTPVEPDTELVMYLPPDLEPGRHTLYVRNVAEDGLVDIYAVGLTVAKPLPWWWLPLAGTSGVAVLAGLILLWRVRRSRT
ncbi:MAG TPA: GDSL-type esterase/lipase family protein [Nocardia sp.]|uniref:GDSL-type esterase/lipase family protein n=1 Tax=Nocardia sp. TaxID=1821 RepID=UPI002B4AE222|nr:GDSL-type esterase/lipase family protein [Nocardia sp.]HLS77097.1 GDSL-type esterase/lipase family protein [Nocardia sp.]